jgi:murein L,D-transpeptidase YcbB/YkuD
MFMFPNKLGIYLHDTPARSLFARADRQLSHGCVRLEHADALYAWLFGRSLDGDAVGGERKAEDLATPVPVHMLRLSPQAAYLLDNASRQLAAAPTGT